MKPSGWEGLVGRTTQIAVPGTELGRGTRMKSQRRLLQALNVLGLPLQNELPEPLKCTKAANELPEPIQMQLNHQLQKSFAKIAVPGTELRRGTRMKSQGRLL